MSEKVLGLKECVALDKVIVESKLTERQIDKLLDYTSAISIILSGKDKQTAWELINKADELQKKLNKFELVPVVSLSWLEKWCKENLVYMPSPSEDMSSGDAVVVISDLLLAVRREAGKK